MLSMALPGVASGRPGIAGTESLGSPLGPLTTFPEPSTIVSCSVRDPTLSLATAARGTAKLSKPASATEPQSIRRIIRSPSGPHALRMANSRMHYASLVAPGKVSGNLPTICAHTGNLLGSAAYSPFLRGAPTAPPGFVVASWRQALVRRLRRVGASAPIQRGTRRAAACLRCGCRRAGCSGRCRPARWSSAGSWWWARWRTATGRR